MRGAFICVFMLVAVAARPASAQPAPSGRVAAPAPVAAPPAPERRAVRASSTVIVLDATTDMGDLISRVRAEQARAKASAPDKATAGAERRATETRPQKEVRSERSLRERRDLRIPRDRERALRGESRAERRRPVR